MYTEEKQPRIKAYRERKNIMKREVIENLLKGEVQKYKDAAAEAESNGKAEIERLQFGYALDGALRTAGAKNSKAVRALLDEAGLKLNGDSIVGLDEQLKTIRENNDYLFNDDTQPVIVRSTPGATGGTGSDDKNKNVNTAIRNLKFL